MVLVASVGAAAVAGTAPGGGPVGEASSPMEHLAADLTAATGLQVDGAVYYEDGAVPSALDALRVRRVVFAARTARGVPRDVYRATLRATPGGTLLSLGRVANLTDTSLGDDGPLVVDGARVAFQTRAFGVVQSAAVLDFGDRTPRPSGLAGLRRALTDLEETGALRAPARWDLRLDRPVRELALSLAGDVLTARGDGRAWVADTRRGELQPGDGATLVRQQYGDKPLVIWAVDTVRALPWVGPAPIAWLESVAFGARDRVHRLAYRWLGHAPAGMAAAAAPEEEAAVLANTPGGEGTSDPWWPPAGIAPPLADGERGEGRWVPGGPGWMWRLPGAPPAFYRTFLRLDRERPYTRVVLAAMDLRQLELGMQAGTEDPVPVVGPRGDGRIPRRPGLMPRVVAAFNGAFKTEHGAYGMVVNHRTLLPPQPHAATVAVLDDGRVAMGTWPDRTEVPPWIASLRQNLDPLVADGVENPTHRALWGFVLGGIESMPTVRSGLCADGHGHLIYAWGEETTARLLGHAMRLAGCTYGMHLDMNPSHAVFHFLRVDDLATHQMQYQQLATGMQSGGDRFVYYTLKDFFYLALRDPTPPSVAGVTREIPWQPSTVQPPPAWLPAVFTADLPLEAGRSVRLTSLALDRVALRVAPGRQEPVVRGTAPALALPDGAAVLGALELGTATVQQPRGLMVDGHVALPFVPGVGRVEFMAGGLRVVPDGLPVASARDALQGDALVREGAVMVPLDGTVGERAALGVTADGRALLAVGTASARELAAALRDAGAREAVSLDRGAGTVRWHGADGVRAAYPGTAVYVLAGEATAPVVRLEALGTGVGVTRSVAQGLVDH